MFDRLESKLNKANNQMERLDRNCFANTRRIEHEADPALQSQQPPDPPQISPDPDLNLKTNQTLDSARPLQVYSRRKAPPPTSEPVQSSPSKPQDVEDNDTPKANNVHWVDRRMQAQAADTLGLPLPLY
ncbi:uncharacterized protein G2W53_033341 [Senna tora]|uniref:Uncharacterized protein n=1 Tax=Senna tora TaxID=362788 RepID=A0A834SY23_9FABA|nr:uncharacterized protein G2W53_033341 [Senna tora]